ncbi:holin-like protein [Paenibacillus sp. RU4T]|uniref:CidA/LrgA family protein n=1 Tax=Paenibacillus sp. RU4T TaxID=1907394 RepID=UPI000955816B|nr:CidA/LrgA family protein [Paenibacillus sp. RUD330]SIQ52777.1 holin-like protein [Paenibacillus sp. RU4X]SIQ75139.1 holin-like protein [Paenibacillus sp. RU4T]
MNIASFLRGTAQMLFFVAVYEAMTLLSSLLSLPVPGSVLGLALVFILLRTGIIKLGWIELGAGWLLAEMLLFFIPPAAGLVQFGPLLAGSGLQILLVILISSVLVMISAGGLAQLAGRRRERGGER